MMLLGVGSVILAFWGGYAISRMKLRNERLIEANDALNAKYEEMLYAYAALDMKYEKLLSRYRALKRECFTGAEKEKAA